MSGDIAPWLRKLVKLNEADHGGPYQGTAAFACVEAMASAADELDRLTADLAAERAEVVRLMAAGDALAEALRDETVNGAMAIFNETFKALNLWQEARRD